MTTKENEAIKGQETDLLVQPQIRMGSLAFHTPEEIVLRAASLANQLAKIIHKQKLFTPIQGKKYVWCEGWTTMGALLGITPVEEWTRRIEGVDGFESRVGLRRMSDGAEIGAASAECTTLESKWAGRDSHAVRSMAITRATSKAFRLSFSWIMKLAGYEATPAEDVDFEDKAAAKDAQKETGKRAENEGQQLLDAIKDSGGVPTLFCQWPEAHNGFRAFLTGTKEITSKIASRLTGDCKARWNQDKNGFFVEAGRIGLVKEICEYQGIAFHELQPNPLKRSDNAVTATSD